MVQLKSVFVYDLEYSETSFISDPIRLADASSFIFSVYCSENATLELRFIMNPETLDVVYTESLNLTGGTFATMASDVRTSHVIFAVTNFANTPCELQTSAFFNII